MLWRPLLLLSLVAAASLALTWAFGAKVLLALGLILTQIKLIGSKLAAIEWPLFLVWLKTQTALFFRLELIKKYLMTSVVPLIMGAALRRRIASAVARVKTATRARYGAIMAWYQGLSLPERIIAGLIVLFATLALSVTSLGLWLVLFSVKLPFWIVAGAVALAKMLWGTLTKSAFKTVAFLQLGWLWRILRRRLPASYLERKRKWDFRVARAVVRRRRLTLRQLHDQKNGLAMRLALIAAYFRQPRPAIETEDKPDTGRP